MLEYEVEGQTPWKKPDSWRCEHTQQAVNKRFSHRAEAERILRINLSLGFLNKVLTQI